MLKKGIAVLLLLCMMVVSVFAEDTQGYEQIQKGASGKAVQKIQERLQELGYLTGKADGSYWTQTTRAITAFQRRNLIQVTPDHISPEAQELLFSPEALPVDEVVVRYGEKSDNVTLVQQCLYEWGFMSQTPDGHFGGATASALADFQNTVWARAWKEKNPSIPYTDSGIEADGQSITAELFTLFTDKSYTVVYNDLALGDKGPDVGRIQNILYKHNYLWREPDNAFDYFTQAAVVAFQKAHDLPATGVADTATQKRMLESDILPYEKVSLPYRVVVDVDKQKVFVYAWDGEGYTSLVREMICSTGTIENPTPVGVYFEKTGPLNVWHKFRAYNCWAQYSYVIQGGILFHSVLYYNRVNEETGEETHGYLDRASLDNLGTRQSHGCVRLQVEDARWIYNNCPRGTEVEVLQLVPDPVLPEKP